jgi:iron complex outermembrane recepter protein
MKKSILYLFILLHVMMLNTIAFHASGQVIRGRVTDENGNPLAGTTVSVRNTFLGTYTGSDGSFLLILPKAGLYKVKFSFIGYEAMNLEVNLKDTSKVDIKLVSSEIIAKEIIVSATRAGNKTPVAFTNVGRDKISKQNNGQDLPYLIGLTPSLVETSETGTGIGYTGLRIRGTDGSRINVTIDGIPLNDAESQQVFWVDLPDLASSIDNIQVQRGIGTSSNGAGAFGASINIETKSPENIPFADICTTLGSFNTLKNTVMAGTGLLSGKFALGMRYSDIKSDGYIERTGSANRSLYLSGLYKSVKSVIKVNLIQGEEHSGISWWGVPKDTLLKNRKYNPAGEYTDENGIKHYYDNESDNYRQNHFQLIYSRSLSKYAFLHAAFHYTYGKGYYEEFREDQLLTEYGLTPFTIGSDEIVSTDMIRRKWMSNDFYGVVYSLKYNRNRIDAVFGGGLNIYKGDHYGKIIWMRYAGNTEKDFRWYLNDATKGELSVYGKLNYKISDRLNGFGDLNYRYITYKMRGIDDDLRYLSQHHSFNFLNPKAGIFYTISRNQDTYFSFSVAHREPTRSDYKEASGDDSATPLPEALFDTEAGYNIRSEKANLGINLYGMIYTHQLVPTGELSSVGYPIMTNVKKSYRTGIELSAGFKPVKLIDWQFSITLSRNKILNFIEYYTDYITADDSYLYRNKKLGNVDIAYSPSLIGSGNLALNFSEKVRMNFITKYVGGQYFDNTMSRERMIDPYLVNNLRIDFNPMLRNINNIGIQLFVNNIFDNKYENNAYGGNWYEDGIENTWAYYFPQAGINFLIKMGIVF